MPTVAEIARRFGGDYLKKFGDAVPAEHRKVLGLIARCRTGDLGTVVYRVAISDHRIVAVEDGPDGQGQVTFSYRKTGSRRYRKMTVTAEEFLRRFLQHVLPKGFPKVRHYGFLSARRRAVFELLLWLVTLAVGLPFILFSTQDADLPDPTTRSSARCPACGGQLWFVSYQPNDEPKFFDTS